MSLPRPPNEPNEGIEPPNYTQIPNELFTLIPQMSEAELKVALAICRQTFGWHRKEDELSLTDLKDLTGLSRQSVIKGIEEGMARGLIKRRPRGQSFLYRLKVVQNLDQSSQNSRPVRAKKGAQTSLNFGPEGVQNLDSHEDERKGKKDSGGGGAHAREKEAQNMPRPVSRHVPYLVSQGMEAAEEFSALDPDAAIQDFNNRRADNHPIGAIVKRWRSNPPRPGVIYERRATPETQPRRRAAAPAATLDDTQRAQLKLARRDDW